ncbi:MAG TPA: hypothetical protein VMV86_05745 [Methanosarcinales archaeon]|nr:hypothetical protein [Methanosarcinales archaeon]
MNLLQIRTLWIERSGRTDLVVDTTDYVDNGANFFIQAGQRLLDSIQPHRKSYGKYIKDINIGQSSLFINNVRAIEAVELIKTGESRTRLERKSYSWIRDEYGEDFGETAKGTLTFTGLPVADEVLVIGGETYTFKAARSASGEITIGTTVSITIDNILTAVKTDSSICTTYKLTATTCLVEYYLVGTAGNSVVFTTTVANASLDGGGYLGGTLAGRATGITSGKPLYFAPVLNTPMPDLTLDNIGSLDSTWMRFDLNKFSGDGIIWAPPSDAAYTITVSCHMFSRMTADADISYHSEMYPELLIFATSFVLEVMYRNTAGMNDWWEGMKPFLKGIDRDLVLEEGVLSGNTLRG